jgi:hypothetical protein
MKHCHGDGNKSLQRAAFNPEAKQLQNHYVANCLEFGGGFSAFIHFFQIGTGIAISS